MSSFKYLRMEDGRRNAQFSVENPKRDDSSTLVFKRLVNYGDFTAVHQSLFRTQQAKWQPEESYMCAIEFLILNFSFDFRIKLRHQRKNGCQSQVSVRSFIFMQLVIQRFYSVVF